VAKETEAPPEEVEEAPTDAPPAEEGVELFVSHWWGNSFSEASRAFEVYTEKTGNTIAEDQGGGAGIQTLTEFAAGTAGDVYLVDTVGDAGAMLRAGVFLPLDSALDASGIDMDLWTTDPMLENGFEGQIMGLSLFPQQNMMIFVNTELAAETGIELPVWGDSLKDASPEFDTWTWENEMLEFVKAGTKIKADGTHEQWGIDANWGGLSGYWDQIRYRIFSNGGWEFDDSWGWK
jgi:hypothetical protein